MSTTQNLPACAATQVAPVITKVADCINGSTRYRIEGGDIAPGWNPRGIPWCEATIAPDGRVLAYGGEVWPMAWPVLFEAMPRSIYNGGSAVRLTALGRLSFAAVSL